METDNTERKGRIKLKIVTNVGLNLLCTAVRTWRVSDWLPHIQRAYEQVIEDQEEEQGRHMQVVRVKKENYFIANSEVVGDVFDDNEQVFCEIVDTLQYTKSAKKKAKKMLKLSSMDEGKLSVKNHANANSGSARTHQSNIFKEQSYVRQNQSQSRIEDKSQARSKPTSLLTMEAKKADVAKQRSINEVVQKLRMDSQQVKQPKSKQVPNGKLVKSKPSINMDSIRKVLNRGLHKQTNKSSDDE